MGSGSLVRAILLPPGADRVGARIFLPAPLLDRRRACYEGRVTVVDAQPDPPSRRRSILGPLRGLDLILLLIPPLSGFRLRAEVGQLGDSFLAAHVLIGFLGPYLVVAALLFGLRPDLLSPADKQDDRRLLWASTIRVLALLLLSLFSLRLLVAPDLSSLSGPSWTLLLWIGALALPLWSTSLLLRLRGVLTWRALGITCAILAGFAASALTLGVVTVLPPAGMVVPLAVGGGVYGVGIWLAAWQRVEGGWLRIEVAIAALAMVVSTVLAFRVADPPLDTVHVSTLVAFDDAGQRIAFAVERPLSRFYGVAEYQLETDQWVEFDRSVRSVVYAQGRRIVARSSAIAYTLDTVGPTTLCREAPDGEVCGARLGAGVGLLVRGHSREPLVVAHRGRHLVAWDLESDRVWNQERPGTIRWPCFGADRTLYWRVQHGEPPYTQEVLRLDEEDPQPQELTLVHGEGCADSERLEPVALFTRGRRLADQASTLEGPGLPDGKVEIPELVGEAVWSQDGAVLALMIEGGLVRYYTPATGLGPALEMERNSGLALSSDGEMVALIVLGEAESRVVVRSVPDNRLVVEVPGTGRVFWTADHRVLFIRDEQLVRLDPVTGALGVLFPPRDGAG